MVLREQLSYISDVTCPVVAVRPSGSLDAEEGPFGGPDPTVLH